MTELTPITKEHFGDKFWVRNQDFSFAKNDSCCAIVLSEFPSAMKSLPIGFIKVSGAYVPVILQSFETNRNLLVGAEGNWLGRYIPANYRTYPFVLAKYDQEEKSTLCIRSGSDIISESEGIKFFNETGGPSEEISEALKFLSQLQSEQERTSSFSQLVEQLDLFAPWDITLSREGNTQKVEGLYRVDEERLIGLADDGFNTLRRSGMLQYVYAHLFSVLNLQDLANFSMMLESNKAETGEINFGAVDSSESLNFDNL